MCHQVLFSFYSHTVLDIERCDLNIKSNSSSHHTELYGEERLIVRRGQPFSIILHLSPGSKEFKLGETSFTFIVETGTTHSLCFRLILCARKYIWKQSVFATVPHRYVLFICVSLGPLPRKESDTKVSFSPQDSTVDTEWSASATNDPTGNTLSVSISSSPNSPIGVYSLTLDQLGQKTSLGQFTLLFNAWCPRESIKLSSVIYSAFFFV